MSKNIALSDGSIDIWNDYFLSVVPEVDLAFKSGRSLERALHSKGNSIDSFLKPKRFNLLLSWCVSTQISILNYCANFWLFFNVSMNLVDVHLFVWIYKEVIFVVPILSKQLFVQTQANDFGF
jgi:hypothetical protein